MSIRLLKRKRLLIFAVFEFNNLYFIFYSMDDRFDNILFSILTETKTLPNFLDIIFGFLFRRTDFYHIATDPSLGVGLPKGVGEKLLLQTYKKYIISNDVPRAEREEIVYTDNEVKTKNDKKSVTNLESYNGATYKNYSWSQTITDLDIQINIPDNITSKQLSVNITSSKISVKLKNSSEIIVEGELCKKCKHQETIWSLDGPILQIHLEKTNEAWWDCLLQSEPKLDFSKMDCSRPFHELSDEAQAKIEELTWNQERKRQGLPTSDQVELEKALKKAWNAEGSPFSGPYDPSKITLT